MKRFTIILSVLFIFCFSTTIGQRAYWGVTFAGGNHFLFDNQQGIISQGLGTIFKTDKYGNNQQIAFSFDSLTGVRPAGALTEAGNGKLYGFASQGGINAAGCFYEFDPITSFYRVINFFSYPGGVFNSANSQGNGGKPLLATNGKIYGVGTTAELVPVSGCTQCPPVLTRYSKIFAYNPATDVYADIYTFPLQTAISSGIFTGVRNSPYGFTRMTQGSNGKIYITFDQGTDIYNNYVASNGRLYELNPTTNQVQLLYDYPNENGAIPKSAITEYSPGIMYSTFTYGTSLQMSKGGIHKFDVASNSMTIVAMVDTITGAYPVSSLVKVGDKLYGVCFYGGIYPNPGSPYYETRGIIFEFNPSNNQIKKLFDFGGSINIDTLHNPYYPNPNYYIDAAPLCINLLSGNDSLFGMTGYSMFWYKISTGEFKSVLNFAGVNGYNPQVGSDIIQTCTKPYYTAYTVDSIAAVVGQPFSFTIHSNNSETFHWQHNGIFYNDTDSILNFNPFAITDTGRYTCELTNECGTVNTKVIYLKVAVLPVGLLSFRATLQSNHTTLLQWQTSQEYNNNYFDIERSPGNNNFSTTIGRVNGNGSTALPHSYQYTDTQTPEGTSYYRLQQVDFDGQFTYSQIVPITDNYQLITVITNSQAHTLTVNFNGIQRGIVNFKLFASNGQLVKSISAKNIQTQTINTNGLASEVYELQLIANGKQYVKKIVLKQ